MSTGQRKKWLELHPKNQVITKEKLGVYFNTLELRPDSVSKGPVNNWDLFSSKIVELKKKNPAAINSYFFRKIVAVKILYDKTDKIINAADWYPVGGYKAIYIPYTISKIISALPEGKEIDWKRIWRTQEIYPSLAHQVEIVAQQTMDYLRKVSKGGNERTLAIKEDTWKDYKKVPLKLTNEFLLDAVDSSFEKEEAKSQERQAKFEQITDLWSKYMTFGADYFKRLYDDVDRMRLLSGNDREILRKAYISIAKGNLTDRQVKQISQVLDKLDSETEYIRTK